jgi:hypothetical protein
MSDETLAIQILSLSAKIAALETEHASKIAALEAKIAALEAQDGKTNKAYQVPGNSVKRYPSPKGLPEGTVAARDFYLDRGVSLSKLRYHREKGYNGKNLDTTDIPHGTREGVTYHYLTPEQQKKAIDFWEANGVNYIAK